MNHWTLAIILCLAGLCGVLLAPLAARRPSLRAHSLAFAAGVLITVIVAHVIPEAMAHKPHVAGALIMLGFVAMMILQQKVLKADPCCGHDHDHAKHAGIPSYLALVACSINDGILMLADKEPSLGSPLLWAMCAHKITASFALLWLLQETSTGLKPAMRMLYMLIFVMVTPATLLLLSQGSADLEHTMSYVVAVGAGALLYVISSGMVPRVEHTAKESGKGQVLVTFLIAVAITLAVENAAPHHHSFGEGQGQHDHDHDHDGHDHGDDHKDH